MEVIHPLIFKMKKEFNLSEKITELLTDPEMLRVEDVREFVRKLKEEIKECSCSTMQICNDIRTCPFCLIKNRIDKLAGENLSK